MFKSMRLVIGLTGFAFFVATGCATSPANTGREVQLLTDDPPASCKEIGIVSGTAYGPGFQLTARNRIKNEAFAFGGNFVRVDDDLTANFISGTAFFCPM